MRPTFPASRADARPRRRAAAVIGVIAGLAAAACSQNSRTYTLDELTVLNGISGFGDVGRIDTRRDVLAPGNRSGFALKFEWVDRPADPPWWSIRQALPQLDMRTVDGLSFDVYVEAQEAAAVRLYLVEPSDNRWVCWNGDLSGLTPRQWHHVEIRRPAMEQWRLSSRAFEWERIGALGIEPYGRKATFLLDNVRLIGPGGLESDVFTPSDDGPRADPSWHEPVQRELPRGGVYLPFDMSKLDDPDFRAGPAQLARLLGRVGTPLSGIGPNTVAVSRELRAAGVPTLAYAPFGDPFTRYLTRRGAWDQNAVGVSLNLIPGHLTGWDYRHTYAAAHPAVTEAQKLRIDALLKAGISTWMVVDYCLPWMDTWWGYSQAMRDAYRADLDGVDEGLRLREAGGRTMRFAEYFRSMNGFVPKPADAGLGDWGAFDPPKPGEAGEHARARVILFHTLRAYEWLKLPDRVGRHYVARGGQPLWIIPNPEDSHGSPDYVTMLRTQGVQNLFPEWFGCIGLSAEAGWASLPYLRETADRAGSRLSIIHETGAGGHAAPYLDWRVAYNGIYALTAAGRFDDFDNDFISEGAVPALRDPKTHAYQYNRYRDSIAKALAFRQARSERPVRRVAPILCVAERPPARATGSIFFDLRQPHSLGLALSRAHLPFDLRDCAGAAAVLDRYRMIVYSPMNPRTGDFARLRRWLSEKPGRVLIVPAHIPTRDAREWWGYDRSAGLGRAGGGQVLGLGAVRVAARQTDTVTSAAGTWSRTFRVGDQVACGMPAAAWGGGTAVVKGVAGAVLTEARVGRSRVLAFHFTAEDPNDPTVLNIAIRAVATAAAQMGIGPVCAAGPDVSVQTFGVTGGQAVVAWDVPTLNRWTFEYRAGIAPLTYQSAGVARTVGLTGPSRSLVYDFWADKLVLGSPRLRLQETTTTLAYIGADTPTFRRTVGAARAVRRRLRALGFDNPDASPGGPDRP